MMKTIIVVLMVLTVILLEADGSTENRKDMEDLDSNERTLLDRTKRFSFGNQNYRPYMHKSRYGRSVYKIGNKIYKPCGCGSPGSIPRPSQGYGASTKGESQGYAMTTQSESVVTRPYSYVVTEGPRRTIQAMDSSFFAYLKDLERKAKGHKHRKGKPAFRVYAYSLQSGKIYASAYSIDCSAWPMYRAVGIERWESIVVEIKMGSERSYQPLVASRGNGIFWNYKINLPNTLFGKSLVKGVAFEEPKNWKIMGIGGIELIIPYTTCDQYSFKLRCKAYNTRPDHNIAIDVSRPRDNEGMPCDQDIEWAMDDVKRKKLTFWDGKWR